MDFGFGFIGDILFGVLFSAIVVWLFLLFFPPMEVSASTVSEDVYSSDALVDYEKATIFTIEQEETFDTAGMSQEVVDQINIDKYSEYQERVTKKEDYKFAILIFVLSGASFVIFGLLGINPIESFFGR